MKPRSHCSSLRPRCPGCTVAAAFATPLSGPAGSVEKKPRRAREDGARQGSRRRTGRTLYLFERDKRGGVPATAPRDLWPPLLSPAKARPGSGVRRALLGVTRRADGKRQVTYAGHPLYTTPATPRRADHRRAEDFGASWDVVSATGRAVEPTTSDSGERHRLRRRLRLLAHRPIRKGALHRSSPVNSVGSRQIEFERAHSSQTGEAGLAFSPLLTEPVATPRRRRAAASQWLFSRVKPSFRALWHNPARPRRSSRLCPTPRRGRLDARLPIDLCRRFPEIFCFPSALRLHARVGRRADRVREQP